MPIRFARPLAAVCLLSLSRACQLMRRAHGSGRCPRRADFLDGRRREPLDRHARPAAARARGDARRRQHRAVLCGGSSQAPDGVALRRQRQRRAGVPIRARRHSQRVLRRPRARGARARARARRRPLRRHLARREDLPRRRDGGVDRVLRSRRQVHLVAGRPIPAVCSTPPPARRASSTASRPKARGSRSTRRRRRTPSRSLLDRQWRSARGHRGARQGVPHQEGRQRVRAARLGAAGDQRAAARRRRASCTSPAFSGKPLPTRAPATSLHPSRRAAAGRLGVHRDHLDHHRRCLGRQQHERRRNPPRATRARARAAPCTASRRMATGTPCGRSPTMRRTTCCRRAAARCSSRPGTRARSTASPASPHARRW